jgi:parvulin-like peptidyl-prolyl isomerase
MIRSLRKQFQGRFFQIFIWVTIATLGLGLVLSYISEVGKSDWVAVVNGRNIPMNSFVQAAAQEELRIRQFRQQLGQYADMILGSMNPAEMAVERLINEELINQVADDLGIYVDPEVVIGQIVKMLPRSVFNEEGKIDQELLMQILPHYRSLHDFEDSFEQGLRRDLVMHIMRQTFYTPNFLVKQQFINEYLKRKYAVLIFPLDKYIDQEKLKSYSTQELKEFFNEQNAQTGRYMVPEKRSGMIWEFTPKSYGIVVDPKALKAYYNKHKRTLFLKKPVEYTIKRISFSLDKDPFSMYEQAQKVAEELKEHPEKFEDLARQYSQHSSASKGGRFTFSQGSQDPLLEQAVIRLKSDEEISDIIKTDNTLEIIQRIGRKPAEYKPFDQVKSEIETIITNQKFKRAFKNDVRTTIAQGNKNIESFINSKKGKKSLIESQEKQSDEKSIQLFNLKKDEYGTLIEGDNGYLIKVTNIEPKHSLDFSQIKDQVRSDLQHARAKDALSKILAEAKRYALEHGIESARDTYGAQLVSTDFIKRGNLHEESQLIRHKVPVAHMVDMEQIGATKDMLGDQAGYIMQLIDIEPFDNALYLKHKAELAEQLTQQNRSTYESGFIASLRRNATIDRNMQLINRRISR